MKRIILKKLLDPYIPRIYYDEERIKKLAETIAEKGMLQNIILNKTPEGLKPIVGSRRIKALQYLGIETIPDTKYSIGMDNVKILSVSDEEAYKLALIENEQRENLSGVEKAMVYQRLIKEEGLTQEEIGKTIKKSQEYISDKIRLLKLPPEIRKAIITDVITDNHGRLLLSVRNLWKHELKSDKFDREKVEETIKVFQDHLFENCIEEKWSTVKLEEEIEDIRFMFLRVRMNCRAEKGTHFSSNWRDWEGKPIDACGLCILWDLDEDSESEEDLEFMLRYGKKYGLFKDMKDLSE